MQGFPQPRAHDVGPTRKKERVFALTGDSPLNTLRPLLRPQIETVRFAGIPPVSFLFHKLPTESCLAASVIFRRNSCRARCPAPPVQSKLRILSSRSASDHLKLSLEWLEGLSDTLMNLRRDQLHEPLDLGLLCPHQTWSLGRPHACTVAASCLRAAIRSRASSVPHSNR